MRSCTVAPLLRWSEHADNNARQPLAISEQAGAEGPSSATIVLPISLHA